MTRNQDEFPIEIVYFKLFNFYESKLGSFLQKRFIETT